MASSEQLERETEEARARVTNTLEELRARTTPGQLVDQVIDYANASSGGVFFRNLTQQVVDNPLPVVLLGTGLAWLAASGRQPPGRGLRTSGSARLRRAGDRAADMGERIGDRARDMGEHIGDRAEGAAQSASDAIEGIRDRASRVYDTASESARRAVTTVGQSAPRVRRNITNAGDNFVALCKEQPIVLAGIGLALGATIGALLPASSTENRLMGEAADDVKARARRVTDRVKEGAQAAYDEAIEAAAQAPQSGVSKAPSGDAGESAADLGHS